MRRTTFGPLSNSIVNSRTSTGPSSRQRPSMTFKAGDDRRASAFPSYGRPRSTGGSQARQSSLSRSSLAFARPGKRSDPRTLNERGYMQQRAKELISFVIERGYEHPISAKMLTSPSSKDFQTLFLFLVRRIDPTYNFIKRFEDEVPPLLRALGYPFSISKSALSAVGSPHTWPTLLGVLTWLVNLLKYDELYTAAQVSETTIDPQARRDKTFYDNTVAAYEQFLQGADAFPELDAELEAHFNNENQDREMEVKKLTADSEQLAATLRTLQTQPSPLRINSEHKDSLATNIHKFKLLIPSLVAHSNGVKTTLRSKEIELEADIATIKELTKEKARLSDVLARQEEAHIDGQRIAVERERLKTELSKANSDRVSADAELTDSQQLVAIAKAEISETMKMYNKTVQSLQIIETDVRVLVHDGAHGEVFDKDVTTQVLPPVRDAKEKYAENIPRLQEEVHSLKECGDEIEERLIVIRHNLVMLEARKSKLEAEYQSKKAGMNEQLRQRKDVVLQKEEETAAERERLIEMKVMKEKEIKQLQKQLAGYMEFTEDSMSELSRHTERCAFAFAEQQRVIKGSLAKVKGHFQSMKCTVEQDA